MKQKLLFVAYPLFFYFAAFSQAPSLGTAAKKFVLFTTTGAITNNNIPRSQITGDVGSNSASAITGFVNVNGVIHNTANATTAQAQNDLNVAITQINGATPSTTISGALGAPNAGQTLSPGVYDIAGDAAINDNLFLDGSNDPNAVYIIRISGNLSTGFAAKVRTTNGTQACNVFWRVQGTINLASATYMSGNLIAINAAIDLTTNDTLQGRAFTVVGAITTNGILAFVPTGCGEVLPTGPAAPAVGTTASCFAIFSSTGNVTDTDGSTVVGDIGTNSGAVGGYDPLKVTGTIYPSPNATTAACASDLTTLYNNLNLLTPDIILNAPAQFGNNLVLTPNTYLLEAATSLTDTVFFNAQGNSNAVFVIQMNGALTAAAQSYVKLINGAQAKNIFWLARNAAVTWGVNAVFNGSVVCGGAISTATNDSIYGRIFTIAGAITTQGSAIAADVSQCGVALPVKFIYFRGKADKTNVLLEWGTMSELNNKYFVVERSANGLNFKELGRVSANQSTTTSAQNYNLVDREPTAVNYYRLYQIDIDGRKTYYKTIVVKMDLPSNLSMIGYVNGNNIVAKVTGATAGKAMLSLYALDGRKIANKEILLTTETSNYNINKPQQKGVYLISIVSRTGEIVNSKIIVL
jgi:hypothetical protein